MLNLSEKAVSVHENIISELLEFLIENQKQFTIMLDNTLGSYTNQFPSEVFKDNICILNFTEWTLEQAYLDPSDSILHTTLVFGEQPFEIDLYFIDIGLIGVLGNPTPIYIRFFELSKSNQIPDTSTNHIEPKVLKN